MKTALKGMTEVQHVVERDDTGPGATEQAGSGQAACRLAAVVPQLEQRTNTAQVCTELTNLFLTHST